MLSFLNEDNQENSQSELNTDENQQVFDEQQVSAEQDYLVPAQHGKNVKQSTILLAVMFGIGALCVWFMITKITPKAASAAATDSTESISQVILGLKGVEAEMSKADGIAGRFFSAEVDQVTVNELKKNPFVNKFGHPSISPMANDMHKDEIINEAQNLQLLSIIKSPSGNACIIDDKRLRTGDSINADGVTFTVKKITDKYVELTANGYTVKLMML